MLLSKKLMFIRTFSLQTLPEELGVPHEKKEMGQTEIGSPLQAQVGGNGSRGV
jgi:hypothetical protein